ncbi:hypothetical protein ACC737_37310, partial [Rhizobium johnstonii]
SFFVVLPLHYVLLGTEWYVLFAIFIPVYAFLILPAVATLTGDGIDMAVVIGEIDAAAGIGREASPLASGADQDTDEQH